MAPLSPVEPLGPRHDTSSFDCGTHESLNIWLRRHALQNQASDSARTYVACRESVVAGYYSVSAGSISYDHATARAARGLAKHPIPVSLLGRLAVDKREQGKGLGKALLKDALLRMERAADVLGIRAVLVHAIDHAASAFYESFEFERCPGDELHLMLLMKDLRKQLRAIQQRSYP